MVTDTGPGVPEGAVDQVFARGYSTKSSAVAGGRGVGLALVRTICERRGGWVSVRAGDGDTGAVFTAVLGRDAPHPAPPADQVRVESA